MVEQHGRKYEADVYNEVAAKVEQDAPWLGSKKQAERVAGDYSRTEERNLAHGQQFRVGLTPSDYDYRANTHQELQSFVSDNADSAAVDAQGRIANKLGNALKGFFDKTQEATNKEETAWQGPAALQAHQYMSGLADWADQAGNGAQLTSNRLSQSSAAVDHAKNSMPESAGRSTTESLDLAHQQLSGGNIDAGINTLADVSQQAALQQQAHEQAARVVSIRDNTFFDTNSRHPIFVKPPEVGDEGTSASGFHGASGLEKTSGLGSAGAPDGAVNGPAGEPGSNSGGSPVSGGPSSPGIATGAGTAGPPNPGGFQGPSGTPRPPGGGFGGAAVTGGSNELGSLRSEEHRGKPGRTPTGFRDSAGSRLSGSDFGKTGGSGSVSERLPGGKGPAGGAEKGAGRRLLQEKVTRGGAAASGKGGTGGIPIADGKGKREQDEKPKAADRLREEEDDDEVFGGFGGDQKPGLPDIED